jgi:DNA-directed RNA polymerase subunit M/transcription elongation factor TFIIS
MSVTDSKKMKAIYDIVRPNGKKALGTVLKQEQNIKVFEKYIHKIAQESQESYDYKNMYIKITMQVIGDIIKETSLNNILENLKANSFGWDHPMFSNIKERLDEHDEFIINPFTVEEGIGKCTACGCKRIFTYSRHTRSLDESATTFSTCCNCNAKWSYSG